MGMPQTRKSDVNVTVTTIFNFICVCVRHGAMSTVKLAPKIEGKSCNWGSMVVGTAVGPLRGGGRATEMTQTDVLANDSKPVSL